MNEPRKSNLYKEKNESPTELLMKWKVNKAKVKKEVINFWGKSLLNEITKQLFIPIKYGCISSGKKVENVL